MFYHCFNRLAKLALVCLFSGLTFAQSPDYQWVEQAGGPKKDEGNSVSIDPYGNIVVTGIFYDSTTFGDTTIISNGKQDIFIAKYDRDGQLLWALNDGGVYASDVANDVTVDQSGNIYVVGYTSGTAEFGDSPLSLPQHQTAFLVKYNNAAEFQWVRAYPDDGNQNSRGIGVATDADGNIYMAIEFSSGITIGNTTFTGHADGLLVKLSPNGQFLWGRQFAGSYPNPVYMADLATDEKGNCFIAGNFVHDSVSIGDTTLVSTGSYDIFLAKYLPNGTLDWVQQGTGSSRNYAYDVATDGQGNVFMCGDYWTEAIFNTLTLTNGGLFVVKYDQNGNVKWGKSAGGTNSAKALGVAAGPDGSVTLVGWYSGQIAVGDTTLTTGQYDLNALMVNYQANGDFTWALQAGNFVSGSGNDDKAKSVAMDAMGAAIVTGYINDGTINFNDITLTGYGYYDVFVTKVWKDAGLFPQIVVSPNPIAITLTSDSTKIVPLSIQNQGGATLNWTLTQQDPNSTLGDSLDQITGVSPFSVGGIAYDPELDAVWVCDPLLSKIYLYEKNPPYNRIRTLDVPDILPGEPVDVAVMNSMLIITDPDFDGNNAPYDDLIFTMNKNTGDYGEVLFVDGTANKNPYDSVDQVTGITMNDAGAFFLTSDIDGIIHNVALFSAGIWETRETYTSPYFNHTGTISWDPARRGFWLSHLHDPDAPFYFTDTTFKPIAAFPKLNEYNQTIGILPGDTLWIGNTPYITVVDGRISVCQWLAADSVMGTVKPNKTTLVSLTLDATGLQPGKYSCQITIFTNDPYQRTIIVPVYLTVEKPVGIADKPTLPKRLALAQNYPNPFNPTTTIRYQLPVAGQVHLQIYDIMGRPVRELINKQQKAGYYQVLWDGKNDQGESVSTGVYMYKLHFISQNSNLDGILTRKMLLMK